MPSLRSSALNAHDKLSQPQEMRALMVAGRSMDELWRVAEGKWKYSDYLKVCECLTKCGVVENNL